MKSSLYREKWAKFLRRVRLFRHIPFTDFVMASGSLVTGNLRESSDFDVLIGVREGRIFTNRFFVILVFGLAGYFKRGMHEKGIAKDMICPNHFVTPRAYRLSPPYADYDETIYRGLVPIIGDERKIKEFFRANDWLRPRREYKRGQLFLGQEKSRLRRLLESTLDGWLGDLFEKLKFVQIWSIKRGLPQKPPEGARFICSDSELEFHIDSVKTIKKWESSRG